MLICVKSKHGCSSGMMSWNVIVMRFVCKDSNNVDSEIHYFKDGSIPLFCSVDFFAQSLLYLDLWSDWWSSGWYHSTSHFIELYDVAVVLYVLHFINSSSLITFSFTVQLYFEVQGSISLLFDFFSGYIRISLH